jgi:HTH-type transcriptional regulator/antitoxin HipB
LHFSLYVLYVVYYIKTFTALNVLIYMKEYLLRTARQLGPVLQGVRKTRALTQAEVGSAMGVPQSVVSKLEADPSYAAFGRIFKLLAALDLELVVRPRQKNIPSSEW